MKNYRYKLTFLLIIGTAIFYGCDDFLEEDLRDEVTPGNFFNTADEAQLAVNGAYQILGRQGMYNWPGINDFYHYGSDILESSRNAGATQDQSSYSYGEGVSDLNNVWEDCYEVVNATAEFLTRIEGNESLSEDTQNLAVGELLFLRALAYYHLTNIWGDVPYIRELMNPIEAGELGRFDEALIIADMKADLERAITLLPETYPENVSRATRYAAATLKAKFHLLDEEWAQVKEECDFVIDNSPYRLLDNFADVFDQLDPNNAYNDEQIFLIDYKADDRSSRVPSFFNPRIRDEPTQRNQRPDGPGTPRRFELLQAAMAELDQDMTGFGLAIPVQSFADQANWQNGDLRYDVTISTQHLGFDLNFPYFKKNWNLDQLESRRQNHHDNVVVFRLADVYLMAAEAENELNGPGGAYAYINAVRERAFEPDQPYSGMSQNELRMAIRDERKFELAAEGHRKLDLIRWGILVETVQNTEYLPFNNAAANVQPRNVRYPVPQEQIIINPNLLESDPTNNGFR